MKTQCNVCYRRFVCSNRIAKVACFGLLLAMLAGLSPCDGATVFFSESFDGSPMLPAGWTSSSSGGVVSWSITSSASDTAPNAAFVPNSSEYVSSYLTSPSIFIPGPLATLRFRHSYDTAYYYDRGLLEISIAGGQFTDFASAGGYFLTNGYSSSSYPGGWSGSSGGFITTEAYLPIATAGSSVQLRWRFYSDSSSVGPGWFVDTISITDGRPLQPNDISVNVSDAPDPVAVGANLTYTVTVTNTGPAAATAVILTNVLPAGATLVSSTPSTGSCTNMGGMLVCNFGTLGGLARATLTIVVQPTAIGMLTNRVSVTRAEPDAELPNNFASTVTTVSTPALFVSSAIVNEGNSGSVGAGFYVYLSPASTQTVTVHYATAAGTATAGDDYLSVGGSLTFAPGEMFKTVTVPVVGDVLDETNEAFSLQLSEPTNGVIAVGTGTATIVDDDSAPSIVVFDATVTEGNSGFTNAVFTVFLTAPSGLPVTLNYSTYYNGTAASPGDYRSTNGSVTFPPGTLSQTFSVQVVGDRTVEGIEYFSMNLGSVNASLFNYTAYGFIFDDDGLPGQLDHFSWSAITNPVSLGHPTAVTIAAKDYFNSTVSNYTAPVAISATGFYPGATGTLLPSLTHGSSYNDSVTVGYAFTPNTDLIVTHVRHYFGTKVSIWTDDGILLASQNVNSSPGTWVETQLSRPVQLLAGVRYRVGAYSGGGNYYRNNNSMSLFSHGTIDQVYSSSGDGFPQDYSYYIWLVDLRYSVGELQPVAVTPMESGPFVDGNWSGTVTLLEDVPGIVLGADDGQGHDGFSNPFDLSVLDDVSITVHDSPDPAGVGGSLTYTVVVTNTGPAVATSVAVTNYLPAGVTLVSAVPSQGTCANDGRVITCNLGTVPGGFTATLEITVVPASTGMLTNVAVVSRDGTDFTLSNNVASALTAVTLPTVSIDDSSVVEGNTGLKGAVFVVHLSPPGGPIVTVNFATSAGTAGANDFISTNGTLVFAPGDTEKSITVWVKNDPLNEDDETFSVTLSDLTNAVMARSQATGTIVNDDPLPYLYLYGDLVNEGHSGTTNAIFTVLLIPASDRTVSVTYNTSGDTATPASDYMPTNGVLVFPPGVTDQIIVVPVFGDTRVENTEEFHVNLDSATNAYIGNYEEAAFIVNDDGFSGELDHFTWEPIASPQLLGQPMSVTVSARDYYDKIVSNFSGWASLSAYAVSGETNDTILGAPSHSEYTGSYYTLGYAFTPDTDLLVTHVLHYSGTKVSVWADDGVLLFTQAVAGVAGTWNETALPSPVQLSAGTTYRVGVFADGGYVYWRYDGPGEFNHGTIDGSYESYGDYFPQYTYWTRWPLVDLRYSVPNLQAVSVTPTNSGAFSGGIWTGLLSVLQPCAQVSLRAKDDVGHSGKSDFFETGIKLGIRYEGDNVIVHWPITASGCVLESADALTVPVNWTSNSHPAAVVGDQIMVTNPISTGQSLFRLRWQ
jgi:uncharacterized repeat protein (TIGR01451 family)